jgi:creatinine amidohydrolase
MLWENIISNDFPAAVEQAKGVCVVPIGCLEKHGPHSPLGTDIIAPREMAISAAKKEPVVIFPTMYFGEKSGAGEFPGTVIFSVETRWHIFKETCNEIYRNGFKKILFLNGHGGNVDMLGMFTRGMLQENPNVMLFQCGTSSGARAYDVCTQIAEDPTIDYLTEEDRAALRDFVVKKKAYGHGGLFETSWLYHYAPETVRIDRIADEDGLSVHRFDDFYKQKINTHFAWMGDHPNSYSASNDYVINERIARAITEHYENLLAEKFAFLKNETISNEYHTEWLAKQF